MSANPDPDPRSAGRSAATRTADVDAMTGPTPSRRRTRVLAVASSGGHWSQLLLLAPAWEGCDVAFATSSAAASRDLPGARIHAFRDASRDTPLRLALTSLRLLLVLLLERPDVVVSTGSAPGYVALRLGRLLGARTAWIDSIANADELSLSGRKAGRCAQLWLTQWSHLATAGGPRFEGAVL